MESLLPTKFYEILFSSFRGVALTNCVTDRQTGQKQYVSPQKWGGDIILFNNAIKCIKVLLKTVYCSFKISSIFCLLNILNYYFNNILKLGSSIKILVYGLFCRKKNYRPFKV